MDITVKLKERFCLDYKLPIRIFDEPHFYNRLKLLDPYYDTIKKWERFVEEISKYQTEQDYFEEYNRIKEAAITFIKNSEGFKRFNNEDMNQYATKITNLPAVDIYKPTHDKRKFLSIDIKKANFTCLRHYDPGIFDKCETWEDFIRKFTRNEHIVNSKYIRQVILGNCNPRRHSTYEKYLMEGILEFVSKFFIPLERCVYFSFDEIIFDVTDMNFDAYSALSIEQILYKKSFVPVSIEYFTLYKIYGTEGYYKEIYEIDKPVKIQFKCLNNYILPFVIRYFQGEEVTESDKLFNHEGLLSKFIEEPKIWINK